MLLDLRDLYKKEDILDKSVTLQGWIRNHRKQKEFGFIDFNDGTALKSLQIVYDDKLDNFEEIKIVNRLDSEKKLEDIGVISGFGLKNPEYIELAKEKKLDALISGDLCQETAILAKNLQITLIDLGHHESEVPGLIRLSNLVEELDIDVEIINIKPIKTVIN